LENILAALPYLNEMIGIKIIIIKNDDCEHRQQFFHQLTKWIMKNQSFYQIMDIRFFKILFTMILIIIKS